MLESIKILSVKITNESKDKVLEYVFTALKNPKTKFFIITPNPEMLVYAHKHLDYKDKLNHSSIALPDGIGLFFASGFQGENLKERITGVDFIEELCRESRNKPVSMGFLGGKAGLAEQVSECLRKKYPWINVVFVAEEWSKKGFRFEEEKVRSKKQERVNSKKLSPHIDILFVAFGVPKQEEWIYKNLGSLPVKAAMGVGGAFDFISGTIPRAPFIVRFLGMEWLFRLSIEPWRWKRQLALIEFIYLVVREKFTGTPQ